MRHPRLETSPSAPSESQKPRLRMVASTNEGRTRQVREEVLEPVHEMRAEEAKIDERMLMVGIAERMQALETQDRRGKLRLEEAELQNILVRAIHSGKIVNLDRFERDFKRTLNEMMGSQETEEQDEPVAEAGEDERPITKIAAEIFIGVRADVGAVHELERSFSKRAATAESRQLIASNDYLDAAHKIDLVEVAYRPSEKKVKEIEQVSLVQVKSSIVRPEEIEKIHQAHERFVLRNMLAADQYRPTVSALDVAAAFELLKKKYNLINFQERLQPLFEGIARSADTPKDADFGRMMDEARTPRAIVKALISDALTKKTILVLFLVVGMKKEAADVAADHLITWATAHPPTAEEIAEVEPLPPPPRLLGAAQFESVVMHGGKIEKCAIALRPGERKALTAA